MLAHSVLLHDFDKFQIINFSGSIIRQRLSHAGPQADLSINDESYFILLPQLLTKVLDVPLQTLPCGLTHQNAQLYCSLYQFHELVSCWILNNCKYFVAQFTSALRTKFATRFIFLLAIILQSLKFHVFTTPLNVNFVIYLLAWMQLSLAVGHEMLSV